MTKQSDSTQPRQSRKCLSASVSEWLEPTLLPMLKKHGLAEGRLLSRWGEIVGPELARVCLPHKLRYARGGASPPGRDGTLHLRVAPGWQTALHHSSPQILEKIAVYFGYRAVARLQLIPDHQLHIAHEPPPVAQTLSPAATQALEEKLAHVSDTVLHERLTALGHAVLARKERLERQRKAP